MSTKDKWTVLLEGVVGSQAYGLATEESDEDVMRVSVAPPAEFFGLNPPSGRSASLHSTNPDVTVHEVGKFVSLYLKANPSVVEMLWLNNYTNELGSFAESLIGHREVWLSAPTVRNSYLGYARSQFHRLTERGNFGSNTRKRVEKHARHLARLLFQGSELYLYGELNVELPAWKVPHVREFGWAVGDAQAQDDLHRAKILCQQMLDLYQPCFEGTSALRSAPGIKTAEDFLQHLRINHLVNGDIL